MLEYFVLQGNSRDVLRRAPDGSVHCVVTSPPYWGLRDYGVPGQLGLESTPEEYVANMVEVFRDVRQVLRDDGTLWLNIGDSYAVRWTSIRPRSALGQADADRGRGGAVPSGLKEKDLVGIPWMLAFALRADGWYLRSDIIWSKPNPMPESVTDRPTKAHEYLFLLTKSPRYFYDHEAVKEPVSPNSTPQKKRELLPSAQAGIVVINGKQNGPGNRLGNGSAGDPSGRNRRSVWTIATKAYKGAHFAVMPPELARTCVLAGTSARGCCPACGAPWERQTERTPMVLAKSGRGAAMGEYGRTAASGTMVQAPTSRTTGWEPSCACAAGEPVPCTVLDPFNGAATTGVVCAEEGRSYIGIELNAEYVALSEQRLAAARALQSSPARQKA